MSTAYLQKLLLPETARWVFIRLKRARGLPLIVGSAVRAFLEGSTIHDFDFFSPYLNNQDLLSLFPTSPLCGNSYLSFKVFDDVDVVSAPQWQRSRRDTAIELKKLLYDNTQGRDFTVNSLFYCPSTNLFYDPWIGEWCSIIWDDKTKWIQKVENNRFNTEYININNIPSGALRDLHDKIVRMIGDPQIRMKEDPVRALRGIKLVYLYGYAFEENTEAAIFNLFNSELAIKSLNQTRCKIKNFYQKLKKELTNLDELLLTRYFWPDEVIKFLNADISIFSNINPIQNKAIKETEKIEEIEAREQLPPISHPIFEEAVSLPVDVSSQAMTLDVKTEIEPIFSNDTQKVSVALVSDAVDKPLSNDQVLSSCTAKSIEELENPAITALTRENLATANNKKFVLQFQPDEQINAVDFLLCLHQQNITFEKKHRQIIKDKPDVMKAVVCLNQAELLNKNSFNFLLDHEAVSSLSDIILATEYLEILKKEAALFSEMILALSYLNAIKKNLKKTKKEWKGETGNIFEIILKELVLEESSILTKIIIVLNDNVLLSEKNLSKIFSAQINFDTVLTAMMKREGGLTEEVLDNILNGKDPEESEVHRLPLRSISHKQSASKKQYGIKFSILNEKGEILAQRYINDPNSEIENGLTSLLIASAKGDVNAITCLIKSKALPNQLSPGGVSCLFIASQFRQEDAVKTLLENKAQPNLVSPKNFNATALFIAASQGHDKIIKILLEAKGDPDIPNCEGKTPMYIAAENNRKEVVDLLAARQADFSTPSCEGLSPLLIAQRKAHSGIVEVLLSLYHQYLSPESCLEELPNSCSSAILSRSEGMGDSKFTLFTTSTSSKPYNCTSIEIEKQSEEMYWSLAY